MSTQSDTKARFVLRTSQLPYSVLPNWRCADRGSSRDQQPETDQDRTNAALKTVPALDLPRMGPWHRFDYSDARSIWW